jgi:hypothetical protein
MFLKSPCREKRVLRYITRIHPLGELWSTAYHDLRYLVTRQKRQSSPYLAGRTVRSTDKRRATGKQIHVI